MSDTTHVQWFVGFVTLMVGVIWFISQRNKNSPDWVPASLCGITAMWLIALCFLLPDVYDSVVRSSAHFWAIVLGVPLAAAAWSFLVRRFGVRADTVARAEPSLHFFHGPATSHRRLAHVIVRPDDVRVTDLSSGRGAVCRPIRPYSTARTVVAEFEPLQHAICGAFVALGLRAWHRRAPLVMVEIHGMSDGTPTTIELRAVQEACYGAGAGQVRVVPQDGKHDDASPDARFDAMRPA